MLESAVSGVQNELDLKKRPNSLKFFLLKLFVSHLAQFNVFFPAKLAGLKMRFDLKNFLI